MSNSLSTIVTCYFTIPSKFEDQKYKGWIQEFMKLSCNMVIFTDEHNYQFLKSFNKKNAYIIKTTIEELEMYRYLDYWKYCKSIDIEKFHTKELYVLWNEKTFMCERAIKLNPFQSKYFFWSDIGCIRQKYPQNVFDSFPSDQKVKQLPKDQIVLTAITGFQQSDYQLNTNGISQLFQNRDNQCCKSVVRLEGGFFGGHVDAFPTWTNAYRKELDLFIRTKTFGGKDQYIMANIYLKNQDKFHLRKAVNRKGFDIWFVFLLDFCD